MYLHSTTCTTCMYILLHTTTCTYIHLHAGCLLCHRPNVLPVVRPFGGGTTRVSGVLWVLSGRRERPPGPRPRRARALRASGGTHPLPGVNCARKQLADRLGSTGARQVPGDGYAPRLAARTDHRGPPYPEEGEGRHTRRARYTRRSAVPPSGRESMPTRGTPKSQPLLEG